MKLKVNYSLAFNEVWIHYLMKNRYLNFCSMLFGMVIPSWLQQRERITAFSTENALYCQSRQN